MATARASHRARLYHRYERASPETSDVRARLSPSEALAAARGTDGAAAPRPVPQIIELLDISAISCQTETSVSVGEPLFQPLPCEVVFADFAPFSAHTQTLYMRNNDRFNRNIRVVAPVSDAFRVTGPHPVKRSRRLKGEICDGKVAPGMEVCFVVHFKSRECRDYCCDLVCVTDREKFIVPVTAVGPRPVLDLPDAVDFAQAPVNVSTERTVMLRNVGNAAATIVVAASGAFSATVRDAFVAAGSATQVTLSFLPDRVDDFDEELVVSFAQISEDPSARSTDMGTLVAHSTIAQPFARSATAAPPRKRLVLPELRVRLTGTACNAEIVLSQSAVKFPATFISLASHLSLRVVNNSDIPVEFNWKSNATADDDEYARESLLREVDEMEQDEFRALMAHDFGVVEGGGEGEGAFGSTSGPTSLAQQRELAAHKRKFENLRSAAATDPLSFADEAFVLEPLSGTIWPGTEIVIKGTFRPTMPSEHLCTGFLQVGGRDTRLPLQLLGKGLGPAASFSFDRLNLDDVYIFSKRRYEVEIVNRGSIPARWHAPSTDEGGWASKFTFEPTTDFLPIGGHSTVALTFLSEDLGTFDENFEFILEGCASPMVLKVKGAVIGPSFRLDEQSLSFGNVAFGFKHKKKFRITNTCQIPVDFNVRCPEDEEQAASDSIMARREVEMTPASGSVPPNGSMVVEVAVEARRIGVYNYSVAIDVRGLGAAAATLPLVAICAVPDVYLKVGAEELDFGDTFIRHSYTKPLTLVNHSDVQARWEVLPQDEHSKPLAILAPDAKVNGTCGVIEAHSECDIAMEIKCRRLGSAVLPVYISVSGNDGAPLLAIVKAESIGPIVSVDHPEISWGRTQCLIPTTRALVMTNDSLIEARFRALIVGKRSKWRIKDSKSGLATDGRLAPGESITIELIVTLDDMLTFRDTLRIIVPEGEEVHVPLSAMGVGSTIYCNEDITKVPYSHQLTNRVCERRFLLENKGRRTQQLTWTNTSLIEAIKEQRKQQDADRRAPKKGRRKAQAEDVPLPEAVFTVSPDSVTLQPHTACFFTFKGRCDVVGSIAEQMVCEAKVGKDKNARPIFTTMVSADFINPLLEPSSSALQFDYLWSADELGESLLQQPLTLTNTSALPLVFALKCSAPFAVDTEEITLPPGESVTSTVTFDPHARGDRLSHVAKGRLSAVYRNHPQRDHIELIGDSSFPNLELEYETVDFATMVNDTTMTIPMQITNTTKVPCAFDWSFLEGGGAREVRHHKKRSNGGASARTAMSSKEGGGEADIIPVNQVFDIVPVSGVVAPGETVTVMCSMYAHANRNATATAVLDVQGGPEYEVGMKGGASAVAWGVEPANCLIECGQIAFDQSVEREFYILNKGKVPYAFTISSRWLSRPGIVKVKPDHGQIDAHGKQKIVVVFRPGVPAALSEILELQLAHFDPFNVTVTCEGTFASAALSLPATEPENWAELVAEATQLHALHTPTEAPPAPCAVPAATTELPIVAEKLGELPPATSPSPNSPRSSPTPMSPRGHSRGHGHSPAAADPAFEINNEARRIYFMRHLEEVSSTSALALAAPGSAATPGSPRVGTASPRAGTASPRGSRSAASKRGGSARSSSKPVAPAFVIAEYVANFGNVVYGTTRKKVFRVTNTSPIPVTMSLDTKVLFRSGFSVEPEIVSRLPPGQSQEFTVKFLADSKGMKGALGTAGKSRQQQRSAASKKGAPGSAKRGQKSGLKLVNVPLIIKSGPQMVLQLKANITMPDLIMSPSHLDFESVLVGQCRKMYFTVRNPTPVLTEWSTVKDPKMAANPRLQRVATKYVLEPTSGRLKSGESQTLCVTYTPTEAKADSDDSCTIAIKCTSNPQIKTLGLNGQPGALSMAVEPAMITLGPMLPGGARGSTKVTLKNTCDYPIEVFSVDFDQRYALDETSLRESKLYSEDGMMLLPAYIPGSGLPASVTATEATEGGAAEGDAEAAAAAEVAAPVSIGFVEGESLVAVVAAPKYGGGEEIAASLAEKYELALISLDEVIVADAAAADDEVKEASAVASLKERLSKEDCKRGFVIASLTCAALASEAIVTKVVAAAIGSTKVHIVCIKFDPEALALRVKAPLGAAPDAAEEATEAAKVEEFDATAAADMSATVEALQVLIASAAAPADAETPAAGEEEVSTKTEEAVAAEAGAEAEVESAVAEDPLHSINVSAGEDSFNTIYSKVVLSLPATFAVKKKKGIVVPPSETFQVVKRAVERFARPVSQHFKIESYVEGAAEKETVAAEAATEAAAGGDVEAAAVATDAAVAVAGAPAADAPAGVTRWVIPARGTIDLRVSFLPEAVGKFDQSLAFEIFMAPQLSASSASLFCRGLCAVPSINTDPRNVFMRRTKAAPPARVSKKFVMSRNTFEFGPLLIGKDAAGRDDESKRTNSDTFRISNDGPFTAKVDFKFLKGMSGNAEGESETASDVFVVEPTALELESGETKELCVWAYPTAAGTHEATLKCSIENSPEIVKFDCSCIGASAAVEIHGPWEQQAVASPAVEEGEGGSEEGAATPAAATPAAGGAAVIDFQRLLIGRQEMKTFTVQNTCLIPVAWRLDLSALADIAEFSLSPDNGMLKAGQAASVAVTFTSSEVKKLGGTGEGATPAPKITVEFCDAEHGFAAPSTGEDAAATTAATSVQKLPMTIQAEAYKIDTVPIGNESIDFGDMLVGRELTKEFQLTNNGKYPVHYRVKFARPGLQSMFVISPMEGALAPAEELPVSVTFKAPADRRMHLINNKDIKVMLFDHRPGEVERLVDTHDVVVSVQSHFAEVRLQPLAGINFGAVSFCETRKRRIEIKNDSIFPSYFAISTSRAGAEEAVAALQPKPTTEEGAAAPVAAPDAEISGGEPLSAGPYTITPSQGKVPAGGSITMEVIFAANGNRLDKEMIYIGVNDLDRRSFGMQAQRVDGLDDAGGSISFELTGESCIPGMVSPKDLGSLFEEQEVVHTLIPPTRPAEHMTKTEKDANERALLALRQKRVFSRSEKMFSFGCYVITSGEERTEDADPSKRPSSSSASRTEAAIPGTRERFRITNPCKVPCTVRFGVESIAGSDEGLKAFTVHPEKIDLPPHEHRFVSVYFKPVAMQEYRANFVANVEVVGEQTEPSTLPQSYTASRNLSFGLVGEGTLPSVVLSMAADEKGDKDANDGNVEFGRLRLGRTMTKTAVLRNDGAVVATVRLDMQVGQGFSVQGRGSTLMLYPRDEVKLPIVFNPSGSGTHSAKLEISTLHNRFDQTVLTLTGESYMEDVTFEGLPDDAEDELRFDDQYFAGTAPASSSSVDDLEGVDAAEKEAEAEGGADAAPTGDDEAAAKGGDATKADTTVTFELRNTADDTVRFVWGEHTAFTFSPAIGHIAPRSVKRIEATFEYTSSADAINFDKEAVALTTQRIKLTTPSLPHLRSWDTSKRAVSFGDDEDATAAEEAIAEPEYEGASEEKELQLLCTARADWTTFTCSVPRSIVFRDTFMFQSRVHSVPVTNTSATSLDFDWSFDPSSRAFTIEPAAGSIEAGATTNFVIRFAPMDAEFLHCTATCNIPHLKSDTASLVLEINGSGRRPICHFDLPRSAYLRRRPAECRARSAIGASGQSVVIDSSTRVIEMTSVGTRVKNTRRFTVTNPTSKSYEFEWDRLVFASPQAASAALAQGGADLGDVTAYGSTYFTCPFARGVMLAGRSTQMTFEYTPVTAGNHESLWRFRLPQQNVSALFLLAGSVVEPRVRLDTSRIDFRQSLVGVHNTETVAIINDEHVPFPFAFDRETLRAAGVVTVNPARGVVPPMGRISIEVEFSPTAETHYNFNLQCNVQHNPLQLNVKGEGYAVHETVLLVMSDLEESEIATISAADSRCIALSNAGAAALDFGRIFINSESVRTVVLCNTGKFHYDFDWSRVLHPMLQMEPMSGTVHPGPGNRVACKMTFAPTDVGAAESASLDGIRMACTVAGAHRYTLSLMGKGDKAAVDFSFKRHNFGPCFVDQEATSAASEGGQGLGPSVAVLSITNNEADSDVTLDGLFDNSQSHLNVNFETTVLRPRETVDVRIVFTPREERRYEDELTFEVNGLYKIIVRVGGIGTSSRLELTDPAAMSLVAFGALRANQTATRSVRIINRGQRVSNFELCEAPLKKGEEKRRELSALGVSWDPAFSTSLRPNEIANIAVTFAPTTRIPMINEGLWVRVDGNTPSRLMTVTGCCEGIDVALETDHLAFGEVCEHSRLVRKLHLINSGDLPARFRWESSMLGTNFSITPLEGTVMPSADVKFDVTFHPEAVASDLKGLPRCYIDGGIDGDGSDAATISMTLTGSCIVKPEPQELTFDAAVCAEQVRSVTIENPTATTWHVRPAFENEFWKGPDVVEVAAKSSADCEVTYRPLAMTAGTTTEEGGDDSQLAAQHIGSLFIALPDGNAISYSLIGTASAPEASSLSAETVLTTPAKKALVITLPVRNLHKMVQRFDVSIEHDASSLLQLKGAKSIAVPANGGRDYKLTFYSFTEGLANATVKFANATTGLYVWYTFKVDATAPGVYGSLSLESNVRQTSKQVLRISNPLDSTVELPDDDSWWSCGSPDVRVVLLRPLRAQMDGTFDVEYRPLVATKGAGDEDDDEVTAMIEGGVQTERLTLHCGKLGDFHYDLELKADDPAAATETLRFKTWLGGRQRQVFKFTSFSSVATTYNCSVDGASFQVSPTVAGDASTSWAGTEVSVEVLYEPSSISTQRAMLVVSSDVGGSYRCILTGDCIPPQPQGPFNVATGGSMTLPFKNVFAKDMEFVISTDSDAFSCDWADGKKTIAAKTDVSIVIKCASDGASTGKMMLRCPEADGLPVWVYYFARE